ncbi:hypothetical protein R6Q59_026916 [Mikania micrantha]
MSPERARVEGTGSRSDVAGNVIGCRPSRKTGNEVWGDVLKVYASMEKIKACYVLTKTYDDVEFAEMMVTDACFILGFILQVFVSFVESNLEDVFYLGDIVVDLVLLENQIPFFFLAEIFKCTIA